MYTRNNDQALFIAVLLGMGIYYAMYKMTHYIGLDTNTGLMTFGLLILLFMMIFFAKYVDFHIPDNIFYPILGVGLAICFFPIINDYALKASDPKFHLVYDGLSYSSNNAHQEFGPTEITVFWGKMYFKPVYMLVFGLFGYGIQALKNKYFY